MATIGRPKIVALADRVLAINPACRVTTLGEFFTAKSAAQLLAVRFLDWVVDAIDGMSKSRRC